MTGKKNIIKDVTLLNNFSADSDHRMVRVKGSINIKKREWRWYWIQNTQFAKWRDRTAYQEEITRNIDNLEHLKDDEINMDKLTKQINMF